MNGKCKCGGKPRKGQRTCSECHASDQRQRRSRQKIMFHLSLVISKDETNCDGYDLDNTKPWPLGSYATEKKAIDARNALVVITGSRP